MGFDTARFGVELLQATPDAVVYADAAGRIRFWNAGAERMFGYPAAEALDQTLDIIIPEKLRDRHWQGYRATMCSGTSRYGAGDVLAVPAMRKDGSRLSVEFTITMFADEAGAMQGIAAIMRDVTPRFQEMQALRRRVASA